MKITITYAIAMAAARDAGNRHMREAGRDAWDEEDFEVALEVLHRLQAAAIDAPAARASSLSGVPGVHPSHRRWRPWRASVRVNGRTVNPGTFRTVEEAAAAQEIYRAKIGGVQ